MSRKTLLYYLAAVGVAGISLWLAYGPLETGVWLREFALVDYGSVSRDRGLLYEFLRAVLVAVMVVAGTKALSRDDGAPARPPARDDGLHPALGRLGPVERKVTGCAVAAVVAYHPYAAWVLANTAEARLGETLAPYLAYLPYSLAVYVGMILPLVLLLVRTASSDTAALSAIGSDLRTISGRAGDASPEAARGLGHELRNTFERYRIRLLDVANSHLLLAALVILYFVLELKTPIHQTLAVGALDVMKTLVWVLGFGVGLFFLVAIVFRYQRLFSSVDAAIERLQSAAAGDQEIVRELFEDRRWIEEQHGAAFFKSLVRRWGMIAVLGTPVLYFAWGLLEIGLNCDFLTEVFPSYSVDVASAVVEFLRGTEMGC